MPLQQGRGGIGLRRGHVDRHAVAAFRIEHQPAAVQAAVVHAGAPISGRRCRQRLAAQGLAATRNARAGRIDKGVVQQRPDRQAHRVRAAPAGQRHRFQHITRRRLGRRTGGTRADADAGGVEQIEQRLAGQTWHGEIQRGRQRVLEGSVEFDRREGRAQGSGQAFAHGEQLGVGAEGAALFQRPQDGAEGGDAGHVLGARTLPGFLAAAAHQRRERRTGAHIQHADALRRIQFMAGERRVVDAGTVQRQGQLAERLHAVGHPQRRAAGLLQHRRDAVQVGHHAAFVVGGHRAQEGRARRQFAQQVEAVAAVGIDRQRLQGELRAEDAVPVRQALRHGLVLGGAVEQQVATSLASGAPFAHGAQGRQHGGLDALGGAAGEHHPARRRAQHAVRPCPRIVEDQAGAQAGRMAAAGIAEIDLESGVRGGDGGRQHGRCGIGVEIEFGNHNKSEISGRDRVIVRQYGTNLYRSICS